MDINEKFEELYEETKLEEHCGECGAIDHIDEAKPRFEVKYAAGKKSPIKVTKFMTLDKAKKFLAKVKKDGMNGMISMDGKAIKLHKVIWLHQL